MSAIVEHYEIIHEKLLHEKENLKQQLKSITNDIRFQFLSKTLNNFYEEECSRLQIKKDDKLSALIRENNTTISPQQLWIPELALHESERSFILNNEEISDASINAAISIMIRHSPNLFLQQCSILPSMLVYAPLETIHIHHNNRHHFCTSSSIGGSVRIFDSLNTSPSPELMRQLAAIYSPDESAPQSFQINIRHPQIGGKDCGLYAIAYAFDLALGLDPSASILDQSKMRSHLVTCFEKQQLIEFPKFRTLLLPSTSTDITRTIPDTEKCKTATKSTPQKRKRSPLNSPPIETSNQYSPLNSSLATDDVTTTTNNNSDSISNKNNNNNNENSNKQINNNKNSNLNVIDTPPSNSTSPPRKRQKTTTFINLTSTIINFSSKRHLQVHQKTQTSIIFLQQTKSN